MTLSEQLPWSAGRVVAVDVRSREREELEIGNTGYLDKTREKVKFVSSFRILPPGGRGQYAGCPVVIVRVQQCGDGS